MNFLKRIEEKGIKKSYLAKKIGISGQLLGMYLRGERSMKPDVELKLKELLK
jgi:transcriptional regulator with XRE-family HTH domain